MGKSIMILGVNHLDNPDNGDLYSYESGDVKSKKRQNEIEELIQCLKAYKPTKIALEIEKEMEDEINNDYNNFLCGKFELTANEKHQIGFRLAKEVGLSKVHCVNWNKYQTHVPSIFQWVSENKCSLWDALDEESLEEVLDNQRYLSTHTIREFILKLNEEEVSYKNHQFYIKLALICDGSNNIGAQWVAQYWYYRNMIIYKNIIELFEEKEERILLIIGAAHNHLLKQFFRENGDYHVVDAISYLKKERLSLT